VHQKFLNKELPTEKFFLFTLHVQPEASTDVLAPYFVEQISVIRQIALSLPPNYRLVVKEHVPAFGSRSSNFYKTIQSIPNVWLLSPEFSNQELLKVCSGVVTITGTIGWEAWCVGKPVAVFGNTRYDSLPGVYKVSNAEQLKNWVRGVVLNQFTIQSPHEIYCAVRTLLDTTCSGFLDHLKHNKRTLTNENVHSIAEGVYARYLWLLKTSKIKQTGD
jgi:capsule polysaccharide modification protein KpsS